MRLNQFLAHAGLGSRRSVEDLITSGRVTINGTPATLQSPFDPGHDDVRLDGRPVRLPDHHTYIMLNKPPGYTVTRDDPHASRSVYQLLPSEYRSLAHVGRLDRDSEGLLLFCDDGELCHRLLLPSYKVEREYQVSVQGDWSEDLAALMVKGIGFPDGPPLAATRVVALSTRPGGADLQVVLREGKKREVRRLCSAFNLSVNRLSRVRFGTVVLANLAPGQVRALTAEEASSLRALVHLPRK